MERFFENAMYASRWLLAPIYMGLSLALLALTIKFFQEIFHVIPNIFAMAEADLILVLLSLIDMALVGGLLVMVMISGYENFVSQLDIDEGKEKLSWLGKMDSGSLKNKVAASIVAISSIHLLRIFMDAKNVPDNKLMWYVIIHMTFVLSAFAMGYLDKQTRHRRPSPVVSLAPPGRCKTDGRRRFRLALPVAWARLSCDIGRTPGAGVLRIVGAWRPDDAGNRAGAVGTEAVGGNLEASAACATSRGSR